MAWGTILDGLSNYTFIRHLMVAGNDMAPQREAVLADQLKKRQLTGWKDHPSDRDQT